MKKTLLLLAMSAFSIMAAVAAPKADFGKVVPQPASISYPKSGNAFVINASTVISTADGNADMKRNAGFLGQYIQDMTGLKLKTEVQAKPSDKAISLVLKAGDKSIPAEGYVLNISAKAITITGSTPAGVFYGIQTLRKSLPIVKDEATVEIPAAEVTDAPRFGYRGMMLDCGRHYFSADFVKEYIDLIALHNMNRFHWHLTEDQGWRLPVEGYPKLIEVGSKRHGTTLGHDSEVLDGIEYGGYYTDAEIRDIVKYAADRYITIIPEIDMPGHMMSALASYPELGCTGGPYQTGQYWGVYKDVLCAGNPETYKFVEAVLDKVCELFPGQYIHIGGDESPRERWESCPKCQAMIAEQHLVAKEGKSAEALLQGYFTRRVQAYLESKGKKIIGWDELLGCDVDTTATIMSWRGAEPGAQAAQMDHDVIMSPNSNAYFDYYQSEKPNDEPPAIGGFLPVEKVYSFEPMADKLTAKARQHIIGVQANLWTEYISVPNQAEYMVLPRMAAICEVQWMQPDKKDYNAFKTRLDGFRHIYDLYGLTYAHHLWPDEFRKALKEIL